MRHLSLVFRRELYWAKAYVNVPRTDQANGDRMGLKVEGQEYW